VHPAENKHLSADGAIQLVPNPKQVAVLLSQHIGAGCKPLVAKKDKVEAGQMVGDTDAFVSAPVHSPVNGTVKDIALQSHPVLGRAMAVIIDADPDGAAQKKPCAAQFGADFDVSAYSAEKVCEAVRQAGIVGMGGAGFPTRVKIEPNPRMPKHTLIINGCECEPFITCDYRIMLEWTYQIIAGIKLAFKAAGCSTVIIGIEDNKSAAIEAVQKALANCADSEHIEVVPVKTKYPQGGERQLINSLLRKFVPTGGIPPMIGICVLNVATCAAIAEAVATGAPLTHRVATVTGGAISKPGNYYVPIGMQVADLIEQAGGLHSNAAKVILGGPMMGLAIADLSTPITKASGAVTILTKEAIYRAKYEKRQTPCIRCGRCLDICPENLNPTKIAHAVKHNLLDVAAEYYMAGCMECGCCSYVCPANIELTGYIKTGKLLVARAKEKVPV
jgi:electron transport complex protein RnfC